MPNGGQSGGQRHILKKLVAMSTAGGQKPNFSKHVTLSTGDRQADGGQREQSFFHVVKIVVYSCTPHTMSNGDTCTQLL